MPMENPGFREKPGFFLSLLNTGTFAFAHLTL